MLQSPFYKLSKTSEKKLTTSSILLLIILFLVMHYFDSPLHNSISTSGIVSFELAKTLTKTEAILNSWNTISKTAAGMSLGFDFIFLVTYSLVFSLLIHKLNEYLWKGSKIHIIGTILIWCMFLAAFFDIIENIALIKLLLGDLQQTWSTISYYFASFKFSLLAIGILYILINFLLIIFKKIVGKYS